MLEGGKTDCRICGVALEAGAALYSPDGELVCDDCHRTTVEEDRAEARARYLASAGVLSGAIAFFVNPLWAVSIAAIGCGVAAFMAGGALAQGRPAARQTARHVRNLGPLGALLGVASIAASVLPMLLEETPAPAAEAGSWTGGCDADHPESCEKLANMHLAGEDYDAAEAPLNMACAGGIRRACYLLGNFHDSGAFSASSPEQALRFYERTCEMGDRGACEAATSMREDR